MLVTKNKNVGANSKTDLARCLRQYSECAACIAGLQRFTTTPEKGCLISRVASKGYYNTGLTFGYVHNLIPDVCAGMGPWVAPD